MTVLLVVATFFGSSGLVLSTIGFPLLAAIYAKTLQRRKAPLSDEFDPDLEILIPAFNEETVIHETLDSVHSALDRLASSNGAAGRFLIGLDHCTDGTERKVLSFLARSRWPGRVVKNDGPPGKWNILLRLVRESSAEWIALVDAGAIWNPELLIETSRHFRDAELAAVAPSYVPRGKQKSGNLADRIHWKFEEIIKLLENTAGGPVTVHGATVFYRRAPLLGALDQLRRTAVTRECTWINDDVAIPLMLRILEPTLRIRYVSGLSGGWVSDVGMKTEFHQEIRRRRRIVAGNLQWVRGIYVPYFARNFPTTIVASRRVFRLFWAYWLLMLLTASGMFVAQQAQAVFTTRDLKSFVPITSMFAFGILLSSLQALKWNGLKRFLAAFLAGLLIPLHLVNHLMNRDGRRISWS